MLEGTKKGEALKRREFSRVKLLLLITIYNNLSLFSSTVLSCSSLLELPHHALKTLHSTWKTEKIYQYIIFLFCVLDPLELPIITHPCDGEPVDPSSSPFVGLTWPSGMGSHFLSYHLLQLIFTDKQASLVVQYEDRIWGQST